MARQKIDRHHRAVRQIRNLIDAGQVWRQGPSADIDEDPLGAEHRLADLHLVRCDEPPVALVDRAIFKGLQTLFDGRPRLTRNRVLSGLDPWHVDSHRRFENHSEIGGTTRRMGRMGAGDQCLRRNAAGIDASTAERPSFDHRDGLASGRKPARKRRPRLPGADDDGIVGSCHFLPPASPRYYVTAGVAGYHLQRAIPAASLRIGHISLEQRSGRKLRRWRCQQRQNCGGRPS